MDEIVNLLLKRDEQALNIMEKTVMYVLILLFINRKKKRKLIIENDKKK